MLGLIRWIKKQGIFAISCTKLGKETNVYFLSSLALKLSFVKRLEACAASDVCAVFSLCFVQTRQADWAKRPCANSCRLPQQTKLCSVAEELEVVPGEAKSITRAFG